MEDGIISFLIGSVSGLIPGYYIAKIFLKAKVKEMISEETSRRIQDLEFDNGFLEKKLSIVIGQNDLLMKDAKKAFNQRNNVIKLVGNKLGKL